MAEPYYFTCPNCGGHYFGRDVVGGSRQNPIVLETVRCQSDRRSSDGDDGTVDRCDWRGVWPPKTT